MTNNSPVFPVPSVESIIVPLIFTFPAISKSYFGMALPIPMLPLVLEDNIVPPTPIWKTSVAVTIPELLTKRYGVPAKLPSSLNIIWLSLPGGDMVIVDIDPKLFAVTFTMLPTKLSLLILLPVPTNPPSSNIDIPVVNIPEGATCQ